MSDETQAVLDRVRDALVVSITHSHDIVCDDSGTPFGVGSIGDVPPITVADLLTLLAIVDALREDARRMDWLERAIRAEPEEWAGVMLGWEDCAREQFRVYRHIDEAGAWGVFTNGMCEAGTDLRAAIDAARTPTPEGR